MPSQETTTDEAVCPEEISPVAPDVLFAAQFGCITRRVSRALLRHSALPALRESPDALYRALHRFFAQWSLRHARAAAMRLSPDATARLLRYGEALLFPSSSSSSSSSLTFASSSSCASAEELIASAPRVPLASLQSALAAPPVRVPLAPMAEVLEMARALDRAQALRTPLGAVNAAHVVALGAALCPAPDMRALLRFVAASVERCATCAVVCCEWAAIDRQNAESLRALQAALERSDGSGAAPEEVVAGELVGPLEAFGNAFVDEFGIASEEEEQQGAKTRETAEDGAPRVETSVGALSEKRAEAEEKVHEGSSEDPVDRDSDGEEIISQTDMNFWRNLCN